MTLVQETRGRGQKETEKRQDDDYMGRFSAQLQGSNGQQVRSQGE